MKRIKWHLMTLLACCSWEVLAAPQFIPETKLSLSENIKVDAKGLCQVAHNTQTYLGQHPSDNYAVHEGVLGGHGVTLARVKATLDFICNTYHEDKKNGHASRLNDGSFLSRHFEFIRWLPDKEKADQVALKSTNEVKTRLLNRIPNEQIFLTKYYTKLLKGSSEQTEQYSQALYQLPSDEQGLTQEQALLNKDTLTRFKYTRQQVISGVLQQKQLAKPLVWITEEALHDVLLQGTGVLNVDGKTRYFNVHRNNGIAYDYHIGKREQARYWYFAEVPSIMGYGNNIDTKIALTPQVSVAGNVKQLGLGKLFMFEYTVDDKKVNQMAVLADEGGAFDDNLFQLDLLVGSYYGWKDYHLNNKHLPDYASAWIMVVKQ